MEEVKLGYDKVSEVCAQLRKVSAVNEGAREKVLKIVQEVKEVFARNLERWWERGLDAKAQALIEQLLEALDVLSKEPDEAARRKWCVAAKTIAIELEIIRQIHF